MSNTFNFSKQAQMIYKIVFFPPNSNRFQHEHLDSSRVPRAPVNISQVSVFPFICLKPFIKGGLFKCPALLNANGARVLCAVTLRTAWCSCAGKTSVRGRAPSTSGTSWSRAWSWWWTTTRTIQRSAATGTTRRSRGRGKHAPSARFTARSCSGRTTF